MLQLWEHHCQHSPIIFSPCGSWINPVRWVFSSLIQCGNGDLKSGERETRLGRLAPRESLQHLRNLKYEIPHLGEGHTTFYCWPHSVGMVDCF